jgi:hypothetical protein
VRVLTLLGGGFLPPTPLRPWTPPFSTESFKRHPTGVLRTLSGPHVGFRTRRAKTLTPESGCPPPNFEILFFCCSVGCSLKPTSSSICLFWCTKVFTPPPEGSKGHLKDQRAIWLRPSEPTNLVGYCEKLGVTCAGGPQGHTNMFS